MKLSHVQFAEEEWRLILEAGFLLRGMGRLDDAEAVFRGMIELRPDSELPHVALGTVELQRGRLTQALEACADALRLRPESLYAHVHHAEVLLFQRRREEAEAELHQVIESDPESPHSHTARTILEAADVICSHSGDTGQ